MLRAYKYRLYPTKVQAEMLNKQFGACRFIYNLALETKMYAWQTHQKNISAYDLHRQLTDLRKGYDWLQEVNRDALEKSILNLDAAYKSFFRGEGFPKFKNKNSKQSFRMGQGVRINWSNGTINIPKIKNIKVVLTKTFNSEIQQATLSKTATGKYFISILIQDEKTIPEKMDIKNALGIDLGLKHFAITSDGKKFENPKYLRESIGRLKVLQRRVNRKIKGSANRRKANLKGALLHERITNQRKDFLHKLSTQLIKNHDTLCLENLNISGIQRNHTLALSVSDVGWGMFVEMLKYKAEWNGNNILQIGRFEPSSKTCSDCGCVNSELQLSDREWTCSCGAAHDRDINAAANIKNIALSGKGIPVVPVEMLAIAKSMKQEVCLNHVNSNKQHD